jgi:hypothetical protein
MNLIMQFLISSVLFSFGERLPDFVCRKETIRDSVVVQVDFWKDVYPILETNCFRCHNERKAAGGFRADIREYYFGNGNQVLVIPGKSSESLLVQIITGEKVKLRSGAHVLTATEVGIIAAWIDEGAEWPDR